MKRERGSEALDVPAAEEEQAEVASSPVDEESPLPERASKVQRGGDGPCAARGERIRTRGWMPHGVVPPPAWVPLALTLTRPPAQPRLAFHHRRHRKPSGLV